MSFRAHGEAIALKTPSLLDRPDPDEVGIALSGESQSAGVATGTVPKRCCLSPPGTLSTPASFAVRSTESVTNSECSRTTFGDVLFCESK